MNARDHSGTSRTHSWRRAMPLLLIIPYIGTLWVSTYASITPEVWGIPFFYWYQFLWIGISAAITIIVYLAEDRTDASTGDGGKR